MNALLVSCLLLANASASPDAGSDGLDGAGGVRSQADAGGAQAEAGTPPDSGAPVEAGVPVEAGAPAEAGAAAEPAPSPAGPVLAGTILARGTREPLVGAQVRAIVQGKNFDTESDDKGAFRLEVPSGACEVVVLYPGFERFSRPFQVSGQGKADLVLRLDPKLGADRYETVVKAKPERAPAIPVTREELTRTPGAFGDPFRVVESLPGVVQALWPLPMYAIRGANPGNTGFFVDGVRAPALFHFALGPSVIHPFFLNEMQFYPGGYPIQYGRYVSGVVTASTQAPATDRLHVSADVRLFDAGGIAAMPFDEGRGTVAIAGRYSYTGLALSAFSSDYGLDYWDYQVRIEHRLGPGRLTFFAFGSGDRLEQKHPDPIPWETDIPIGLANLMFHRVQLRWDGGVLGGRLQASVLGGYDDSTVSNTQMFDLPIASRSVMAAPRLGLGWRLGKHVDLDVGGDGEIQRFWPRSTLNYLGGGLGNYYQTDLFRERTAMVGGAYAGMTFRVGDRLQIMPGIRYETYYEKDRVTENQISQPSPRLSLRYRVAGDTWLKGNIGQFSQMPSLPVGVPGFESFGLTDYGLQRSRQGSVGVETGIGSREGADLSLDTSVFYQRLRVTDLRSSLSLDPQERDYLQMRDGESYGFEVILRRPMRHRFYGWLSYTWSRSFRVVDGVVSPSDWDQRHVLNLVAGYRLPRGYSVSSRFHYNTGRPYPLYDKHSNLVDYRRLPSFPQLDLRGDKRFIFDNYVMDVYIELVNTTLSREVYDEKRLADGSSSTRGFRLVLPSVGVHVEW